MGALSDKAGKGTERYRPGKASVIIGQEAMEKSDPDDGYPPDAVQPLKSTG